MSAGRVDKARLTTWKEVAAFFGKTERTVMRWEAERGLPVRRLPGEARSSIYAEVAELEAWLRGPGAAAPELVETASVDAGSPVGPAGAGQAVAPPQGAHPRLALAFGAVQRRAAAALFAVAGLIALAFVVARALPHRTAPPPAAAQAYYMRGLQDWAQRTPQSLNKAVDEFTAAIRLDDSYAAAYVGLANCYNLLREFTAMPGAQAYRLAKTAAQRAIALQPDLAGAHAAYAFTLYFGDWNFGAALAEYQTALRLEPGNPGIRHWYATTLLSLGEDAQALAHIDRALELDPASRAIRADRALILYEVGRRDEARAVLLDLAASAPDFLSSHAYLASIFLQTGDDSGFVREQTECARLQHGSAVEAAARAAARGLAAGGHAGMLAALLAAQQEAVAGGSGEATDVAATYALLGNKGAAMAWLLRAVDRHDDRALSLMGARFFRDAVGDAALLPLRNRLHLPGE
jgi:tetratricopeptide (TPR) repeat protein